jgi:hypothetical protein
MPQKYICPIEGCGREALPVKEDAHSAPFATGYILPRGKTLEDMPKNRKGHPLPLGVQHNILVECPEHGRNYVSKPTSHHVDKKYLKKQ